MLVLRDIRGKPLNEWTDIDLWPVTPEVAATLVTMPPSHAREEYFRVLRSKLAATRPTTRRSRTDPDWQTYERRAGQLQDHEAAVRRYFRDHPNCKWEIIP